MKSNKCLPMKSLFIVFLSIFLSFNLSAGELLPNQGDLLYSWIDDLRIRDDAGKTIGKLRKYDGVTYLGKHSEKKKRVVLRDQKFNRFNYLVKTNKGIIGWVYGGALKLVTGIKPVYSETAGICLALGSRDGGLKRSVPKKQKIIDGTEIYSFLSSLKHGKVIYQRPIYESGCLGTLEEKCYSNNLVVAEHEGGSGTTLFGDFDPVVGLKKGMAKAMVLEKLGQPKQQNKSVFIYRSFYYLKQKDYQVSIDYYLNLFFDDSDRIEAIKISSFYHEDC